ncbi:cupin domain-containing protein, partial [Colletotrichum melonis]
LPPASGKVVFTLTQYPTILRILDSDLAAHQAEHPTTAIQPLFPPLRRRTSRDRPDHNGARQQTKEPPGYWKPAPSLARAPLAQACCLAGQPTVTMASLIPLINDLIPMIVPSSVSVTKATTLRPPNATLNPASANEADAVVSKSDKLCASGSSRACHDSINPVPSHGLVSCSLPRLLQLTRVVITLNPHATSAIRHHGEQG